MQNLATGPYKRTRFARFFSGIFLVWAVENASVDVTKTKRFREDESEAF